MLNVFASIAFLAAASPAALQPSCTADAATGLPVPHGVRGACVATFSDRSLFVQRSEEGLLIATLSTPTPIDGLALAAPATRVIFCPTGALEFKTGAPTAACVKSSKALEPGPAALTGTGAFRGNLRTDKQGRTRCPSAARIVATVSSPSGTQFDLTGSIALVGDPSRADTCTIAYDRIELDYKAEPAPPAAATASPDALRQQRIQRLMQLTDGELEAVDRMLALTPQDWQVFQAVVAQSPGKLQGLDPPFETYGVIDVVNTILARVNAVGANVTSLVNRVGDRPDVRNLVARVNLTGLNEMLGQVGETIQGLVDVARELREGYDSFDVAQFRTRLGTVLDDVGTLTSLYQRLLCIDDPDIQIRELNFTLLRRLIDRAPAIVLYALSRILDTIDPQWDQRIGDVVANIPGELLNLCNDGLRPMRPDRVDFENVVCSVLRPKERKVQLGVVKAHIAVFLITMRYAKNHTKEEIEVTAGATVVAGGTAGTSVKNPAHEAAEQWVERLESIKDVLDKITDRRKDCLDMDKDIEDALADCVKENCICRVPLSVLLDGAVPPSYTYVAKLIGVRIVQAAVAGIPDIDVTEAQTKLDTATDSAHDETAEGYKLLCQAYGELLPSTGGMAVAPERVGR